MLLPLPVIFPLKNVRPRSILLRLVFLLYLFVPEDLFDLTEVVNILEVVHSLRFHHLLVIIPLFLGHLHSGKELVFDGLQFLHLFEILCVFTVSSGTKSFFWLLAFIFSQHLDIVRLVQRILGELLLTIHLLKVFHLVWVRVYHGIRFLGLVFLFFDFPLLFSIV